MGANDKINNTAEILKDVNTIVDFAKIPFKLCWEGYKYLKAGKAYPLKTQAEYQKLGIAGISSPILLQDIFTDVKVFRERPALRQIAKQTLEEIQLGKKDVGEELEARADGMGFVRRHDRLFILGKPGAGKTTFLKYLTLRALEEPAIVKNRVPVFISLNEFSQSEDSLEEFILQFPETRPYLSRHLKTGALVLCDGLDEVATEDGKRQRVIRKLKTFIKRFMNCQFIITCRLAAVDDHFSNEGFTVVEIVDFTPDQMRTFVYKWFRCSGSGYGITNRVFDTPEENTARFFQECDKNPRLYDLARTPLFLTLLCIEFEKNLKVPASRSGIYKETLQYLLKTWDPSRGIKRDGISHQFSFQDKQSLFARVAATTFETKDSIFRQEFLEQEIKRGLKAILGDTCPEINGEAVLTAIEAQHGILVRQSKEFYAFSHLTFQEYFTAYYIVENIALRRHIDEFEEVKLPEALQQHITEFLTSLPTLYDSPAQQAFLNSAGIESRLQQQLQSGLPVEQFVKLLVSKASKYGKFEDGRYAIEAVLEAAKEHVGQDRQAHCDRLIQEVDKYIQSPTSSESVSDFLTKIIQSYYTDPDWREVFLLTAEMLDNADEFFEMFLKSLGDGICKERKLVSLFKKVDKEATRVQSGDMSMVEIRTAIMYLIMDTSFLLDRILNRSGSNSFTLDHVFSFDSEDSRSHAIKLAFESAIALDRAIIRACLSALALTESLDSGYSRKVELVNARSFYKRAVKLARRHDLTPLQQALEHLSAPAKDTSAQEWQGFADALIDILHSHRSVEEYEFTEKHFKSLEQYLTAAYLVRDCLKAAANLSNPAAIEERLLRCP